MTTRYKKRSLRNSQKRYQRPLIPQIIKDYIDNIVEFFSPKAPACRTDRNPRRAKISVICSSPNVETSLALLRGAEVTLRRDTAFGIISVIIKRGSFRILKKQALSLVEIMITIVILSTCLVLIVRSFTASLNATRITQGYAVAELLLEDKMWQIEQQGLIAKGIREQDKFPEPYQEYEYILETQAAQDIRESEELNEVKLTVSWQQGRRNNRISIVTYLENKPR